MKNNNSVNNRCELKTKFSKVFNDRLAGFSTELQRILIDDMITAFEIRLNVLKKAQTQNGF